MSIAANCADDLSEKMSSTVGRSMAEVRGGGVVSWVITCVGAPGEHEEEPFFDVPAGVQAAGERGRARHAHQLPASFRIGRRSGKRRHSVRMAKVGDARGRTVEGGRDAGPVEVRASPRDPGLTCPPRLLRGVGCACQKAKSREQGPESLVTCVGLGSLRGEAWAARVDNPTSTPVKVRAYLTSVPIFERSSPVCTKFQRRAKYARTLGPSYARTTVTKHVT